VDALVRPGPAIAYEVDRTQFIAIAMGPELWAFTLDGTVPARGAPVLDPWVDYEPPRPAPRTTSEIETATLIESRAGMVGGRRYGFDEHRFNPVRALVTAGARVRFVNNGKIAHSIAARDGSWNTGTLEPATSAYLTLDAPGTFLYHCTDHPWAIGEITVEP